MNPCSSLSRRRERASEHRDERLEDIMDVFREKGLDPVDGVDGIRPDWEQ